MGRPLSQNLLEKMNIKVSVEGAEKKLVKQVGFNKYETEDGKIVTLGEDASLLVVNGDKSADVIKIVRNTLYTNGGFAVAYRIKEEGGIELKDTSFVLSTEVEEEVEEEVEGPSADMPTVDDNADEPESEEGSGEGMGEE